MVNGKHRSGSAKRTHVKTPNGTTVMRFKRVKVGAARCQLTGETLAGVPRLSRAQNRNTSKSSKRPSRPFGGALSPNAMKRVLIEKARSLQQ